MVLISTVYAYSLGLYGSMLLSASLTTKDGNNPSFRVVQYDPSTYAVLDYTVYYTDLSVADEANPPKWTEEYTFSTTYGIFRNLEKVSLLT
jgi:hypothetical protein